MLECAVELDLGEDEELRAGYFAYQTCLVGPVLDGVVLAVQHTFADDRDLDLTKVAEGSLLLRVLNLGRLYARAELVLHQVRACLLR